MTDTYSKFPEVEIVKSTSAKACIPKLDCIFSTHGIPKKIKTDNGPPFNENEFKRHMAALGIECELDKYSVVAPRQWKCRKCDEAVRKSDKDFHVTGKNWRQEHERFLLNYRSTPHATTKIPRCERS